MRSVELQSLYVECRRLLAERDYARLSESLAPLSRETITSDLELCLFLASAWSYQLKHAEAKALLEEAKSNFLSSGDEALIRSWQNAYGVQLIAEGELSSARKLLETCLRSAERSAHLRLIAFSCNSLGVIASYRGELQDAVYYYSRSITAWQQLGDRRGIAFCHYNLAVVLREWMHIPEATKHFFIAQEFFSEQGTKEERVFTAAERAMLFMSLGDVRLAEQTARKASELADDTGDYLKAATRKVEGIVAHSRGQHSAALDYLQASWRIAETLSNRLLKAEVNEELALAYAAVEDERRAEYHYKNALTFFEGLGAVRHCERLKRRFGTF